MAEGQQSDAALQRERLNVCLDYFKHMTTITGAAVVGLLAVYQQHIIARHYLAFALGFPGISAAVAVYGMRATAFLASGRENRKAERRQFELLQCLRYSGLFLIAALFTVLFGALNETWRLLFLVLYTVVAVAILFLPSSWRR